MIVLVFLAASSRLFKYHTLLRYLQRSGYGVIFRGQFPGVNSMLPTRSQAVQRGRVQWRRHSYSIASLEHVHEDPSQSK